MVSIRSLRETATGFMSSKRKKDRPSTPSTVTSEGAESATYAAASATRPSMSRRAKSFSLPKSKKQSKKHDNSDKRDSRGGGNNNNNSVSDRHQVPPFHAYYPNTASTAFAVAAAPSSNDSFSSHATTQSVPLAAMSRASSRSRHSNREGNNNMARSQPSSPSSLSSSRASSNNNNASPGKGWSSIGQLLATCSITSKHNIDDSFDSGVSSSTTTSSPSSRKKRWSLSSRNNGSDRKHPFSSQQQQHRQQQLELASKYCQDGRIIYVNHATRSKIESSKCYMNENCGCHRQALIQFQQALPILEHILGANHKLTAKTYYWIGFLELQQREHSNLTKAFAALVRTWRIRLWILNNPNDESTQEARRTLLELLSSSYNIPRHVVVPLLDTYEQNLRQIIYKEQQGDGQYSQTNYEQAIDSYQQAIELEYSNRRSVQKLVPSNGDLNLFWTMDTARVLFKLAQSCQKVNELCLPCFRSALGVCMINPKFDTKHQQSGQSSTPSFDEPKDEFFEKLYREYSSVVAQQVSDGCNEPYVLQQYICAAKESIPLELLGDDLVYHKQSEKALVQYKAALDIEIKVLRSSSHPLVEHLVGKIQSQVQQTELLTQQQNKKKKSILSSPPRTLRISESSINQMLDFDDATSIGVEDSFFSVDSGDGDAYALPTNLLMNESALSDDNDDLLSVNSAMTISTQELQSIIPDAKRQENMSNTQQLKEHVAAAKLLAEQAEMQYQGLLNQTKSTLRQRGKGDVKRSTQSRSLKADNKPRRGTTSNISSRSQLMGANAAKLENELRNGLREIEILNEQVEMSKTEAFALKDENKSLLATNQTLMQSISRLESVLADTKTETKVLNSEQHTMLQKVRHLEAELSKMEKELDEVQEHCDSLYSHNDLLTNKISTYLKSQSELQSKLGKARLELQRLKEKNEETNQTLDSTNRNSTMLQQQLDVATSNVEALVAETTSLKAELLSCQESKTKLQEELQAAESQVAALQDSKDTQLEELEKANEILQQQLEEAKEEATKMASARDNLATKLESLEAAHQDCLKKLGDAHVYHSALHAERDDINSMLRQSEQSMADLNQKVRDAENEYQVKLAALEKIKSHMESQLDQQTLENQRLQSENKSILSSSTKIEAVNERMEELFRDRDHKLEVLRTENMYLKNRMEKLEESKQDVESLLEVSNECTRTITEQKEQIEEQVISLVAEKAELESRIQEMEEQCAEQKAELEELQENADRRLCDASRQHQEELEKLKLDMEKIEVALRQTAANHAATLSQLNRTSQSQEAGEIEEVNESLLREIELLKTQKQELQQFLHEECTKQKTVDRLRSQNQRASKVIKSLSKELVSSQKRCKHVEKQCHRLKDSLYVLKEQRSRSSSKNFSNLAVVKENEVPQPLLETPTRAQPVEDNAILDGTPSTTASDESYNTVNPNEPESPIVQKKFNESQESMDDIIRQAVGMHDNVYHTDIATFVVRCPKGKDSNHDIFSESTTSAAGYASLAEIWDPATIEVAAITKVEGCNLIISGVANLKMKKENEGWQNYGNVNSHCLSLGWIIDDEDESEYSLDEIFESALVCRERYCQTIATTVMSIKNGPTNSWNGILSIPNQIYSSLSSFAFGQGK